MLCELSMTQNRNGWYQINQKTRNSLQPGEFYKCLKCEFAVLKILKDEIIFQLVYISLDAWFRN